MLEYLKLSQIGSSPLPLPFMGLHSPGVRKHCQIIFACYLQKSSIMAAVSPVETDPSLSADSLPYLDKRTTQHDEGLNRHASNCTDSGHLTIKQVSKETNKLQQQQLESLFWKTSRIRVLFMLPWMVLGHVVHGVVWGGVLGHWRACVCVRARA